QRAAGGLASLTIDEVFVDHECAPAHAFACDITTVDVSDEAKAGWKELTDSVKDEGCAILVELNHAGDRTNSDIIGRHPIGPVGYDRSDGETIIQMDEAMMSHVADNFAHAAKQAKKYGFTGILLHAGHGWLLSQFLSPLTNTRTDEYGGSLENRARFSKLVLERIREAVGDDFIIEFRISAEEVVEGGLHLPEAVEYCKMIEHLVDIIHVTKGIYSLGVETGAFTSYYAPHGSNVALAAEIKKNVSIPVAVVGGLSDPQMCEDIIASGKADFVAMARQIRADPNWANKVMSGLEDEISPCLRCSCFVPFPLLKGQPFEEKYVEKVFRCTVNPCLGKEALVRDMPEPSGSRNVLVIGGGVGGMYAAITAAERGHKVTLVEKENELGGIINLAKVDHFKSDMEKFRQSLITRLGRRGVEVLIGKEVDADFVRSQHPEAVICAVGSDPLIPPIPGIEGENVVDVLDSFYAPDKIGKRVVVVGGGLSGCDTGIYLATEGHDVTLIGSRDEIAMDANISTQRALGPKMDEVGVKYHTGMRCERISDDGVYARDKQGEEHFFPCDTVVNALGRRPRTELVAELEEAAKGVGASFVAIGDCVKKGDITASVSDGFLAAMSIL
ncbi:MAG: FAD-dependent oxidoreductase, partial [Actinobacteria bacterium]|nr:FAD-dependent oxidoreductase [Actinomycetota bacterium]